MKKNKVLRTAAILLALVLLTTCGMTGALAKYVETFTAVGGNVRAGLWKVDAPGAATIGLQATLYEGNTTGPTALVAEDQSGVAGAKKYTGSLDIIVPGTIVKVSGLKIVNYSEVDVQIALTGVTVALTGNSSNVGASIPAYYSVGSTDPWSWSSTVPALTSLLPSGTGVLSSFPAKSGSNNEIQLKDFYILWPFENAGTPVGNAGQLSSNTDIEDTDIGKDQAIALLDGTTPFAWKTANTATTTGDHYLTVSATVTATQID